MFKIANRQIGREFEPYVIAEISANHQGSIENAFELIRQAKLSGADAVKMQTYRPDTITIKSDRADFKITEGLWAGRTLYELYEEAHTPWEWHDPLFDFARKLGIPLFSSPFDETAVDLLESLNVPAYKIASFEAVDPNLIKYVAATGKPMIISTGMATADEIQDALNAATQGGCKQVALLHCVSGYPAPAEDYNLRTLTDMYDRFQVLVGLSDHTLGNVTAITSIGFGACIIEKHFTLSRELKGPDSSFSLEPSELKQLCSDVKTAWKAIGRVDYTRKSSELQNLKFRRSLYFVRNLRAGQLVTSDAIKSIRPGYGLEPKHFETVLGKKLLVDVSAGTPVSIDVFEKF